MLFEISDLIPFHRERIHNDVLTRSDFHVFYTGGRRFLTDSLTLYVPEKTVSLAGYSYPPPSVILFIPYAMISEIDAYVLYQFTIGLSLVLIVWITLLVRQIVMSELESPLNQSVLFALLVATSGPAFSNSVSAQPA